jgi:hypothetical protein
MQLQVLICCSEMSVRKVRTSGSLFTSPGFQAARVVVFTSPKEHKLYSGIAKEFGEAE